MGREQHPHRRLVAISPDDGSPIDLRNPCLAAALAWLVPGLGHLYQGRRFKGGLFMAALLGCLVGGMWLGGGRVVYASWRPGEPRLAFIGQAGIGVAAIPALVQAARLDGAAREPCFGSLLFAPPLRSGQLVSPAYAARLTRGDPGITAEDFFDRHPFKEFRRDQLSVWQRRLGRRFEIGTLSTVLAGMLNILAVLDAFSGPLRTPADEERKAGAAAAKPPGSAA